MIKALFFDFYDTLVRWEPLAEQIQREACAAEGIDVNPDAIRNAYPTANLFMDAENARKPIVRRSNLERDLFFDEYERRLLAAAGVTVPLETARRIWTRVHSTPKGFTLYEDALPALDALSTLGLTLGVLSNMGPELEGYVQQLGLNRYVSVIVSSGAVGINKPHAAFFEAALEQAGVPAAKALHVGDSYEADYLGARNAGLYALLLVRPNSGGGPPPNGVDAISSLDNVMPYLQSEGLVEKP